MDQVLERHSAPEAVETIEATLNYIVNNGEKLFTETGGPGGLDRRSGGTRRSAAGGHPQRPAARAGVRARARRVPLRPPRHQGCRLLRRGRGAPRLLSGDGSAGEGRERRLARRRLRPHAAHRRRCDARAAQDPRGRAARAQRLHRMVGRRSACATSCPTRRTTLLARRFAIIQVWRPIRHPVESFPLAICDARSVSFDDLVISERRYPNRVGQTYAIAYNPKHKWFWFPRMRREEAMVFKVFDSAQGRPRPLDRAHRLRRSDLAAQRASAREHRNPHAGVFLRRHSGARRGAAARYSFARST